MSTVNLNIRMCFVETFESFRGCDDAHEFNVFSALFFDKVNGCFCGATGCEHWIYDH